MASFTVQCPKSSSLVCFGSSAANNANRKQQNVPKILNWSSASSLRRLSSVGFQYPKRKQVAGWKVQSSPNEVTSENKPSESKPNNDSVTKSVADEASISAFLAQVSDLIKLVDSKDIIELNMKQLDCELIIRKKEAMEPPAPPPMMAMPPGYHSMPPPAPAPAPAQAPAMTAPSSPATSSPLALPPPTAPKKPSGSSHPSMKCPMAGTFYRSPAPGEPPFVKVGDKVQKGQVICIIEAMKLMNEIESDRSGTISEILAEDGKAVSIDMPLFAIAP